MMSRVLPALHGHRGWRLAVNAIAFQAAWFACVAGAAQGQVLLGLLAVLATVALLLTTSNDRKADLLLIGVAVATGVVADTLLARWDVVRYASAWPSPGWAPAWILALWALWGAVLREPLRWLHGRPLAAALLGALGGPLSYAAAERLGACRLPDPVFGLAVLVLGWALVTPLQLGLAARLARSAGVPR